MADFESYLNSLNHDLLEQFRGKANIEVFQKALARQLSQLHEFFTALNTNRRLQTAEGVQLDGIGDIVALSRTEALTVAQTAEKTVPMDDPTYRLYLMWKIALNTSSCTHFDRYRALKMFWNKTPLYYSEDPAHPATIFITVPIIISESEAAVFRIAAMIKAAGVALHFVFPEDTYLENEYSGGVIKDILHEFFIEEVAVFTDNTDYNSGAIAEFVKEVHTEYG